MRRRYSSLLLLLFLVIVAHPTGLMASETATCPYDIAYAATMIPSACYANATAPTATSCCWFVYAAFIYAAIRNANLTGAAFLPPPAAANCSNAFAAHLISRGLARPSLLLTNGSCELSGDPTRLAAGNRPCQYPTVSSILAAVPATIHNATRLCDNPSDNSTDLSTDQPACAACQTAVIAATFSLLDYTNSKEFVPCGMAATIGIWSSSLPSLPRFRSYALCMVQILENINDLGTSYLIPSPPPPPSLAIPKSPTSSSSSSRSKSRSIKIATGSAFAALASTVAIAFLAIAIVKLRRRSAVIRTDDTDPGSSIAAGAASPLPTDGLYIFTKSELKQATNGYDDRLILGEGGAGKVYLGKLPSGQHVAIKRIYRERKIAEFYREVEILAKLRHRNLATMLGYCLGEREHVLVYEYMPGGNLSRVLYHGELPWRRRLQIAVDVAEGLVYLHEFPEGAVVHRDVKPTNVLLSESGAAKLSDFGVSRILPQEGTHLSTEVRGTMGYVDPESFAVGQVSESADVYSFGVVLLELVTGMRAVVATPSGGAESIVQTTHVAMTGPGSDGAGGALEALVDRRLGAAWDRATVGEVFAVAYRCVRPYKNERPRMADVLAVLKAALADLEARTRDVATPEQSTDSVTEGSSDPSTTPGWSL